MEPRQEKGDSAILVAAWVQAVTLIAAGGSLFIILVKSRSFEAVSAIATHDRVLSAFIPLVFLSFIALATYHYWSGSKIVKPLKTLLIIFYFLLPLLPAYKMYIDFYSNNNFAEKLLEIQQEQIIVNIEALEILSKEKSPDYDSAALLIFPEIIPAIRAAAQDKDDRRINSLLNVLRKSFQDLENKTKTKPKALSALGYLLGATYDLAVQKIENPNQKCKAIEDYAALISDVVLQSVEQKSYTQDNSLIGFAEALKYLQIWRSQALSADWQESEVLSLIDLTEKLETSIPPNRQERSILVEETLDLAIDFAGNSKRRRVTSAAMQFVGDRLNIEMWSDAQMIPVIGKVRDIVLCSRESKSIYASQEAELLLRYIMDLSLAAGRKSLARKAGDSLHSIDSQLLPNYYLNNLNSGLRPYLEWLAMNLTMYKEFRTVVALAKRGHTAAEFKGQVAGFLGVRKMLLNIANKHRVPQEAQHLHKLYIATLERGIKALEAIDRGDEEGFEKLSDENSNDFARVCKEYESLCKQHGYGPEPILNWRNIE